MHFKFWQDKENSFLNKILKEQKKIQTFYIEI